MSSTDKQVSVNSDTQYRLLILVTLFLILKVKLHEVTDKEIT